MFFSQLGLGAKKDPSDEEKWKKKPQNYTPENQHGTPKKLVVWVDVSPFPFGGIFRF